MGVFLSKSTLWCNQIFFPKRMSNGAKGPIVFISSDDKSFLCFLFVFKNCLIDCLGIYTLSAIFRPFNGGKTCHNLRGKQVNLKVTFLSIYRTVTKQGFILFFFFFLLLQIIWNLIHPKLICLSHVPTIPKLENPLSSFHSSHMQSGSCIYCALLFFVGQKERKHQKKQGYVYFM